MFECSFFRDAFKLLSAKFDFSRHFVSVEFPQNFEATLLIGSIDRTNTRDEIVTNLYTWSILINRWKQNKMLNYFIWRYTIIYFTILYRSYMHNTTYLYTYSNNGLVKRRRKPDLYRSSHAYMVNAINVNLWSLIFDIMQWRSWTISEVQSNNDLKKKDQVNWFAGQQCGRQKDERQIFRSSGKVVIWLVIVKPKAASRQNR